MLRALQFVFQPNVKQATIVAWTDLVTSMTTWLDINKGVHEAYQKEITTEALLQKNKGKKKATAFNLRLHYQNIIDYQVMFQQFITTKVRDGRPVTWYQPKITRWTDAAQFSHGCTADIPAHGERPITRLAKNGR